MIFVYFVMFGHVCKILKLMGLHRKQSTLRRLKHGVLSNVNSKTVPHRAVLAAADHFFFGTHLLSWRLPCVECCLAGHAMHAVSVLHLAPAGPENPRLESTFGEFVEGLDKANAASFPLKLKDHRSTRNNFEHP